MIISFHEIVYKIFGLNTACSMSLSTTPMYALTALRFPVSSFFSITHSGENIGNIPPDEIVEKGISRQPSTWQTELSDRTASSSGLPKSSESLFLPQTITGLPVKTSVRLLQVSPTAAKEIDLPSRVTVTAYFVSREFFPSI